MDQREKEREKKNRKQNGIEREFKIKVQFSSPSLNHHPSPKTTLYPNHYKTYTYNIKQIED